MIAGHVVVDPPRHTPHGARVKLRVIVVGRDRGEPLCEIADEYLGRLNRTYPTTLVEVKEEPARASSPVDRVRAIEAERLEKALLPGERVVALDERGKEHTSVELAQRLGRWADEGRSSVAFLIGGPNGLDPALVARADERWALSKLTLPHRLARVVLAEQLYRAATILRGEPYHK